MSTYQLITPSTRGIGLALTRHLLTHTPPSTHLIGTYRPTHPPSTIRSTILDTLPNASSRLHLLPLDFSSEPSITHAIRTSLPQILNGANLSRAWILPGILHPEKTLKTISAADMEHTFRINTLAPTLILRELVLSGVLPARAASAKAEPETKVAIMAARVGSVSDNRSGGWYSYRMSKAAVFQLVRTAEVEMRRASGGRVMVCGYHPGTVRTGLSEKFWKGECVEEGRFEVGGAVRRMVRVVEGLGEEGGGRVWDWRGEEVLP